MTCRTLVGLAAVLAWSGAKAADPRVEVLVEPQAVEDFTLTDQNGWLFRFDGLRDREALLFFGFTSCPNVCPAALFKLKLLTTMLEKAEQTVPAVVLVSVDGERDTPAVMKSYLSNYPDNFIGLTGDPKYVRKIAAGFKAVFFKGLPYDNAGNYQVDHTSLVYLVDAEGKIRASFLDAPVEAMAETTRQVVSRLH